jgi:hypothetical protein
VLKPKSNIAHLRIYDCKIYPLIHKILKKQKLRPRAQIGYLVRYNSSNIFRIWVPQDKKVIETRDVTFNELRKYDLNDLRQALPERVEESLEVIEFPNSELAKRVKTENKKSDIQLMVDSVDSVDSYQSSTIIVDITPKTQQARP